MDKVKVTIHIVASEANELNYDPATEGKTRSDENRITYIKVTDGYSVVFDDNVFTEIQLSTLMTTMIHLLETNVPNTLFDFGIKYHYENAVESYFDYDTAKHVLDLDTMMTKISESGKIPCFTYTRLDGLNDVYSDLMDAVKENTIEDSESIFDYADYEEDEDDEDCNGSDMLSVLMGDKKVKKSKDDSHDYYGRSRIFRNSKQPKKQINRHGVLIATDKDDIKKDEKIIKEFLKDFFPGDAAWKKEFRNDVLQRWMSMYAVSRKNLKQLEKQHRKERNKKSANADRIINFTDKLFSASTDRWSDPNK